MARRFLTFFYRAVSGCGRRGTASVRGRRAGSSRGAAGGRGGGGARRRRAARAGRRRCPAACATAPGPAPGPGRGLDPGPGLFPGPGPALGLVPAPNDSSLCRANRPASSSYPYPCDPCACVYVCWGGRSEMMVSLQEW